jgi:hypothetical protein
MFELQLAFGGDKDGILGPRQACHVAEATAGQHRPVHSAMMVIWQRTAHAPTLVEQDPARTVAAPSEITDQLGANR